MLPDPAAAPPIESKPVIDRAHIVQTTPAAADQVGPVTQSPAPGILPEVPAKMSTLVPASVQVASNGNQAHPTHGLGSVQSDGAVAVSKTEGPPASDPTVTAPQSIVAQPAKPETEVEPLATTSSTRQPSKVELCFDEMIAAARTERREVIGGKLHNETPLERAAFEVGDKLALQRLAELELEQAREFAPMAKYIAAMTRDLPPVLSSEKPDGTKIPIKSGGRFQLDDSAFEAAPVAVKATLAKWRGSSALANALSSWVSAQMELRKQRMAAVAKLGSERNADSVHETKVEPKIELPVAKSAETHAPVPDWRERPAAQKSGSQEEPVAAVAKVVSDEKASDIDLHNWVQIVRQRGGLGR